KRPVFLLQDPEEYREMTPDGETAKAAYAEFYEKMLAKLGYSEEETKQKFENCFLWETMLNAVRRSQAESLRPDYIAKINNVYSRDELSEILGKLPVLETLEQEGYPAIDRYLVPEPAFIDDGYVPDWMTDDGYDPYAYAYDYDDYDYDDIWGYDWD
ncbi:MAG: hypothetical protein ABS901_02325, partial [Candidatus Limivicinus sp.]